MSFEKTCIDIWNLKLDEKQRAKALKDADFLREEFELVERGIGKFTKFGWTRLFQSIGTQDKDAKESLCNAIERLFT